MAMGSAALLLQTQKTPMAKQLAWHFHNRVLPFYARPFSPNPTYLNKQGERVAVPRPLYHGQDTYSEYLAKVESGEIPARGIHGPRHAAGVALLACWLYGRTRSSGPLLPLALAAGMHDAARQDEGQDRWDAESAKLFREIFGEEIDDVKRYVHALEHKDSPGGADTLIRRIIHDADCLEIVRIFLNRYEQLFDPSMLTLFDSPRGLADRPELKQAIEFIRLTENPFYKRYLEEHSTDYLGDLYRTLLFVQKQRGGFELIVNELKPVLQGLEGALPPELEEVVTASL
jgi:hypothetical protein